MELILLGIYAAIVWFIFIKMKWLPWNMVSQVIVVIIPIVALTALILTLNVVAPSSADVRVIKYVVNIVPQVRGRVIEVPVEPNRPVKKGDVLFRIDPTPYQLQVNALEAQLANAIGTSKEQEEQLSGAAAQVAQARSAIEQAMSRVREVSAKVELARLRVEQNRELVKSGAGNKFDLEQAEANLKELEGSTRRRAQRRSAGPVGGTAGHRQPAAGRAAAGRQGQRRVRAGRAGPRPARKREVGPVADDGHRARQRLRDQPATASRVDDGGVPGASRAHLRRGRVHGDRPLQPERAAPGRARQRRGDRAEDVSRAASSRRRSIRSSGRRARASPPAARTCR